MKTALIFMTVVFLAAGHAFSAVPDIKQDCSACHVSHKMTGGLLLKAPVTELCLGCHPDRKSPNDHEVDIKPSMAVSGLPLSADGKMTCITCHDPHGKADFVKMLRASPRDLCLKCHKM